MAKNDRHRWWDWRVNVSSGESIRSREKPMRPAEKRGQSKDRKRRAGNGWWWTLAWRKTGCDNCGKWISLHDKVAYNHQTKQVYCPKCAMAECIADKCRLSRKLRKVGS